MQQGLAYVALRRGFLAGPGFAELYGWVRAAGHGLFLSVVVPLPGSLSVAYSQGPFNVSLADGRTMNTP